MQENMGRFFETSPQQVCKSDTEAACTEIEQNNFSNIVIWKAVCYNPLIFEPVSFFW